ncbi:hypothetical protein [Bacteroides graminisolvens]|nr:hypothetical protein [Bacteroides graminisolvens]
MDKIPPGLEEVYGSTVAKQIQRLGFYKGLDNVGSVNHSVVE